MCAEDVDRLVQTVVAGSRNSFLVQAADRHASRRDAEGVDDEVDGNDTGSDAGHGQGERNNVAQRRHGQNW
jgi:hypothetical protein